MSYETPVCAHCRDTGRKLLDNGEHSDFLDCRHCNAAKERAELEDWATNMVMINRIGYDDGGLRWALHQRAREIEHQEQAVAIAKLSSERDKAESRIVSSTDAFKRIAQAHHAALVAGNGDAGEIAKLADYLNPAAVSHETWRARAVELETTLFETLELLENTDGLSKNNVDNLCGEKADEIRNVLYLPAAKTKPAEQLGWLKFEGDTVLIYGIRYAKELLQDFGYAMPLGQPFVIEKREQDGALTVRKIAPSDTDTAQAARIAELEAENTNLRYELNAALSGGTVSCPAADTDKLRDDNALMHAAINCGHVITADRIVLEYDPEKPGNALSQLRERLNAVASTALQAPVHEVPGWQPIETAPKDGTMFIGWVRSEIYPDDEEGYRLQRDNSTADFCQWCDFETGGCFIAMAGPHGDSADWITHWMPLPAAPVQEPKP